MYSIPSKRISIGFLILVATLFAFARVQGEAEFQGKVVGVADGDTISVMHEGKAEKIRLAEIDCPEKRQAFGRKAKDFTSEKAFGKIVTVRIYGKERYGRTLGEVILPNGESLNQDLLKAGLAWQYRKYSHDPFLSGLESEAKEAKRGLWVDQSPVAPWEFRRPRHSF